MILDIDMGNSRIKWRLRNGSGKVFGGSGAAGAGARGSGPWTRDSWDWLAGAVPDKPQRIRVSSVLSPAYNRAFADWCRGHWAIGPEFAAVSARCAGVTQGYENLQQLGVDRWLAMLAAYARQGGPCLVVSCGTAITADLLDARGKHLGGYIGPGLRLMQASLKEGTLALPPGAEEATEWLPPVPGHSSQSCVDAALTAMACGLVQRGLAQLKSLDASAPPGILLTGGGAPGLQPWVSGAQVAPELVLDGLALALPAG